jgi:hypothetical protein
MAQTNGYEKALSAGWLATRLGIGSARVDVMRRGGELFGVRPPGRQHYVYPSWQFGRDGRVLPIVPRIIQRARASGVDDQRLYEILTMRLGLGSDRRVVDLVREGDEDGVLRAIQAART